MVFQVSVFEDALHWYQFQLKSIIFKENQKRSMVDSSIRMIIILKKGDKVKTSLVKLKMFINDSDFKKVYLEHIKVMNVPRE